MGAVDDLAGRVREERERRGWSLNTAGRIGGVAGETWRQYEMTGNLSRKMRRAVAAAFAWPLGWPEGEAGVTAPHPSSAEERDDAILVELAASRVAREMVGSDLSARLDEVASQLRRVADASDKRARLFSERMARYEKAIENLRLAVEGLVDRFDAPVVLSPQQGDPPPRGRRGGTSGPGRRTQAH